MVALTVIISALLAVASVLAAPQNQYQYFSGQNQFSAIPQYSQQAPMSALQRTNAYVMQNQQIAQQRAAIYAEQARQQAIEAQRQQEERARQYQLQIQQQREMMDKMQKEQALRASQPPAAMPVQQVMPVPGQQGMMSPGMMPMQGPGMMGRPQLGFQDKVKNVGDGLIDSVANVFKGGVQLITHPIDTAGDLVQAAVNPGQTLDSITDSVSESFQRNPYHAMGELAGNIAMIAAPVAAGVRVAGAGNEAAALSAMGDAAAARQAAIQAKIADNARMATSASGWNDPVLAVHRAIVGEGPSWRVYQSPREFYAEQQMKIPRATGWFDGASRTFLSAQGGQFQQNLS